MSICITDSIPIASFEAFDLNHFGLHVNSAIKVRKNELTIWTISLLCVLDISKDESLPKLINVEMSDTYLCCDMLPIRSIDLSPKENRSGEETLWSITLEAKMKADDLCRIIDVEVNLATRRPRKKKARIVAQTLAS